MYGQFIRRHFIVFFFKIGEYGSPYVVVVIVILVNEGEDNKKKIKRGILCVYDGKQVLLIMFRKQNEKIITS